ncbi:unnamed protein product [Chrysoparadoxa australica]
MPFYHQVAVLKPTLQPHDLTRIYRRVCKEILKSGGIVRCVEHHGLRSLPYRFQSKHQVENEERYYKEGRWVSAYFDCAPKGLSAIHEVLRVEEGILRYTNLRPKTKLDLIRTHHKSNPWNPEYAAMAARKSEARALLESQAAFTKKI